MADDKNPFSLEDILWEYADYTPPAAQPKKPEAPLPPEVPQQPTVPPVSPGITSPQPVTPRPAAQPAAPQQTPPANKPAAPQPTPPANQPTAPQPTPPANKPAAPQQTPPANQPAAPQPTPAANRPANQPLPANAPLPANQAPAQPKAPAAEGQTAAAPAPDQPAAQAAPSGAQPATPPAQAPAAEGQAPAGQPAPEGAPDGQGAPAPEGQAPAQPVETGVPLDDGPELIAFTPDPQAAQAQGEGQQPGQPQAASGAPAGHPGQPAPGQVPPGQTPPGQPGPAKPSAPGGAAEAKEPFRPFQERKAKAEEPPPPDAPPAQLMTEYGPGLSAQRVKCAVSGVLSALLLALSLVDSGLIPVLSGWIPQDIALLAGLGLFVVCGFLCLDVLQEGLRQLTNRAPNGDTLALFAAVLTLADGVSTAFAPLREATLPFFAPCALVLTFHLLGLHCDRAAKFLSCRTAASVAQPYLVTQDPNVLGGKPAFRKWMGPLRGFGSQIRATSQAEREFRRLTPVLLVACVALGLVTTVAHHQPGLVFWSLSALFCAGATLGASLSLALPLRLLAGRLAKLGVALAGWPGLLAGKGCQAAVLMDQDVYPPGTVTLIGSRLFGSLSMERTVSYTASVIRASGSGLRFLFDKLLRAEGGSYLPIDKIILQDTGILGQCQDQQILVGNSDFMSRQGIALPPGIKSKDAVFCAVDRELVGMFVLRYTLHPSILPALQTLVGHKISPVMATRDFNLSPHRLRLWGRLSADQITFPDLQRRVALSGARQLHSSTLVAVLCREGAAPFTQALVAGKRIRRAAAFSRVFVNVSACLGVVLTATLSSAGALTAMSPWNLSLFLLLWFVPVLMLSLWTTQY